MANTYNKETKEMIIELYHSGKSIAELSREYGVAKSTIFKWKKEITPDKETGLSKAEIHQLLKEKKQLEEEVYILKKAITIFTKK